MGGSIVMRVAQARTGCFISWHFTCPGKNGRKIARKQPVGIFFSQPHEMLLHSPRDITPINHMNSQILSLKLCENPISVAYLT